MGISDLWQDRHEYDPATGQVRADHVSLWTRWRPARQRVGRVLFNGPLWSAIVGAVVGSATAHYFNRAEPQQQVQPNAGELRLQCVQQPNGILACRDVAAGQHKVVPRPD